MPELAKGNFSFKSIKKRPLLYKNIKQGTNIIRGTTHIMILGIITHQSPTTSTHVTVGPGKAYLFQPTAKERTSYTSSLQLSPHRCFSKQNPYSSSLLLLFIFC